MDPRKNPVIIGLYIATVAGIFSAILGIISIALMQDAALLERQKADVVTLDHDPDGYELSEIPPAIWPDP